MTTATITDVRLMRVAYDAVQAWRAVQTEAEREPAWLFAQPAR